MFFRLLALLVLLSSFTYSQTPSAPAPNPQPADPKVPLFPTDLAGTPYSESAVQKIGHGISAPVPMKTPQAKYTREARERKVQGVCFVRSSSMQTEYRRIQGLSGQLVTGWTQQRSMPSGNIVSSQQ